MLSIPALIKPFFVTAGWKQSPMAECQSEQPEIPANYLATEILKRFGNLRVGHTGAGTEQAACDIHFYPDLRPEANPVVSPWKSKTGGCTGFATAQHDHMILFVNDAGEFFAFTDIDECLYGLGNSFGAAMQKLLLGYSYGAPLVRDT